MSLKHFKAQKKKKNAKQKANALTKSKELQAKYKKELKDSGFTEDMFRLQRLLGRI